MISLLLNTMKWRYFAQNTAKVINIAHNKGQHQQANDYSFAHNKQQLQPRFNLFPFDSSGVYGVVRHQNIAIHFAQQYSFPSEAWLLPT